MTKRQAGDPGHANGTDHYAAKLTPAGVASVRRRAAAGEPLTALAAEYGVGYTTLRKAALGLTWPSVQDAPHVPADLERWSEQDLTYLRAHAAEPLAALAQTLHRSPVAVKIKRSRLGLSSAAGTEAGRALAAQRQLVDLTCAECSVAFSARRLPGDGPRYCSNSCRNRVQNRRRRGCIRTDRPPA